MDWAGFTRRLLLVDGRIDASETAMLRRAVLANGRRIDREEFAFLLRLKREAISVHPDFDEFLFQAIRSVVLADGVVSDAEVQWLREVLLTDGEATEAERQFITRLRSEATSVGKAFDKLYADVMRTGQADFWG